MNPAEAVSIIRSTDVDQIFSAITLAQADFKAIPKDAKNPFFHSKYAALPAVVEAAQPILTKHNLGVIHLPTIVDDRDGLITLVIHSSGQYIGAAQRLHLVKNDPQAQGSAITYARRYGFMSVLNLVADEDDDGNAASRRREVPAPAVTGATFMVENAAGRAALRKLCEDKNYDPKQVAVVFQQNYSKPPSEASNDDLLAFVAVAESGALVVPGVKA